jgi:hypothetical protein
MSAASARAALGPRPQSGQKGLLDDVLGEVQVPRSEDAREHRNQATGFATEEGLDLGGHALPGSPRRAAQGKDTSYWSRVWSSWGARRR